MVENDNESKASRQPAETAEQKSVPAGPRDEVENVRKEQSESQGREAEGAEDTASRAEGEDSPAREGPRHSRFGRRPDLRRLRHGIRPARLRHAARESAATESAQSSETPAADTRPSGAERQRSQGAQESRRQPPASVQELLGEALVARARAADPKLRAQLMGSIMLRFTNSGQKYLFDWSGDEPSIGPSDREAVDCVLSLSEQNLMRIAAGELNPQIAMLSDKVNVRGRLSLAIYWFNLIAPGGMADRSAEYAAL